MANGNLPGGWTSTTIGEITSLIEKVIPQDKPTEPFTYLDISSVDNSIQKIVEPKRYLGADAPSRARQLVKAYDVLFSTVRTYLQNIAMVPEIYDGQIASTGFSVLRASKNVLPKYLFYYTLTDTFLNPLNDLQRGTSYPAVRDGDVRVQPFPLPPLPEQERIVAKIEELFTQLDAGTAALKRVRVGLKRYKASVLKAAVEGRLLPSGRSVAVPVPGELPDGWRWTTTGELCDCIVPNRDKPKSFTGDIPWITLPDFSESVEIRESKSGIGLSDQEAKKYKAKIIPRGSVVMSCIGRFGITAVVIRDIVVNQQLHAFLVSEDVLDARYLAYAIRTQTTYMEKIATATTISYLNKENCNSVPIPLPPLAEQRRIVAEVERRLSVAAQVESMLAASVARAGRLRQSVLKSAFEGRF